METFVTRSEIKSLWRPVFKKMIRECRMNKKAPDGLVELIKHNFFAKYASYEANTEMAEIGVNESVVGAKTYPAIKIYTVPLHELEQKLNASSKLKPSDMEFYAKILTGKKLNEKVLVL